jgi:hypothetical protein
VDLLARFGGVLASSAGLRPLAAPLLGRLTSGRWIDAASRLAGWVATSSRGGLLSEAARLELVDAWNRCVAQWQRSARRLAVVGVDGVDVVGHLATVLELDRGAVIPAWQGRDSAAVDGLLNAVFGSEAVRATAFARTAVAGSNRDESKPDLVVLGHPSPGDAAFPAWRQRVVCLGPGAASGRRGGSSWYARGMAVESSLPWTAAAAGEGPVAPPAVVIRPDHEGGGAGTWAGVEWLPLAAGGPRSDDGDEDGSAGGVWWSDSARGGESFVDAA